MNPRRKFGNSRKMLVSLPLIICVTVLRLSVNAEGIQSSSEWGIKEAQEIVGHYIRDEVGGSWLMDLMKSNSGPLTMADLLKAILRDTNEKDEIWRAATLLDNALKSKSSIGTDLDSNAGLIDNWSDLIAKIETEDDIICLYRKNSNETTKRAEDWNTFLKTVSPGYTIHFAIDAGRKYIICLKRIEIIETTVAEDVTEGVTTTSTFKEITPETTSRMIEEQSPRTISSVMKDSLNDEETSEPDEGSEMCKKKQRYGPNDYEDDGNSGLENDADMANKNGHDTNWNYDLSASADRDWRQTRGQDRGIYDYSRPNIPEIYSGNFGHGSNCQRPILFLLPSRNKFSKYQRSPPTESSAYQNVPANPPLGLDNFYDLPKFSASPANYFRTEAEKLRKINFNHGQLYRPAGVHQPGITKMINYGREMSLRSPKSQPVARRTSQSIQTRDPRLKILGRKSGLNRKKNPKYHFDDRAKYLTKPLWKSSIMKFPPSSIPGLSEFDRRINPSGNFDNRRPGLSEQLNRNTRLYSSRSGREKDQKLIFGPRPLQPSILRPGRPWVDRGSPSRLIGNGRSSLKASTLSLDPKRNDLSRSGQESRSSPCRNSRANYREVNNLGRRLIDPTIFNSHCRNPVKRFNPLCTDKLTNNFHSKDDRSKGCPFSKLCDRPIKLKIVINGRVRDPLRIAVLSEVGNRLEIDGSADPEFAYDSGEVKDDSSAQNGLDAVEKIGIEPEIGLRMDVGNASKEGSPITNTTLSEVTPLSDGSSDLEDGKKSTNASQMESTSIGSNITSHQDLETEQKISLDTTVPIKSRSEPNVTTSSITTNSTTVV